MKDNAETRESVKNYYGEVLASSADLKTDACCPIDAVPLYVRKILGEIDDEILDRFYGCGSPLPFGIEGKTVLDLGCGTGRDAYVASKLVGEEGSVIGVDMTAAQIDVATRHVESQTQRFGYKKPNVDFRSGLIEDLAAVGVEDNSVDVVISNCVINLSPDKQRVFSEIFRVLKPGGELFFADIFCSRRVPAEIAADDVLVGECLGGAMYTEDFRRMVQRLGCLDPRVVTSRMLAIDNPDLEAKLAGLTFFSRTVRAFKLASLEDLCEDYGQVATYKGTLGHNPAMYRLDDHHTFETHRPMLVCGNTAAMLEQTRLAPHFDVVGNRERHFGLFDCGPADDARSDPEGGACC